MDGDLKAFKKSWEDRMENLVKVSAKKHEVVESKHRKIVEGACRVFFEKGYHPTSIREIADSAGMSLGQLYHYISSKDDVLFLIHKHMQTSWRRFLENSKVEAVEEPLQKLTLAVKATFDFLVENKDLIQFIYTESKYLNKEHLRVILEMDDKNVVQFWRELVSEVEGDRASKERIDLAANLITYLMVFYPLRGWNLKKTSQDEISSFLVEFIFGGLGLDVPTSVKR